LKQAADRNQHEESLPRMAGYPRVVVLLAVALLAGCSASWRAPVESRGSSPPSTSSATVRKPTTASPARLRGDSYRVRRGDTLHGIAWQSGIDYRAIARWNGLRPPYRIYAGQTLSLKPPAARRAPPPTPQAAKPAPRAAKTTVDSRSQATASGSLRWAWPTEGKIVSRFKASDPLRSGIKIAGEQGRKIRAAESGKVVYSGSGLIGYGRLIIVKHNDNYLSAYGHNRKILVAEGNQVTKGQTIAEMGAANDGQALLHFEIRRDGKPVDPTRLLPTR
jgi:lipoprotein NlpD